MADDDLRFSFIDPFDAPQTTGYELLQRDGVQLVSPAEVGAAQVRGCLWELIYSLAARHIFLYSTDHLTDEGLYAWLHEEWLPKSTPDLPLEAECNCHVDLLGSGTETENLLWLRYYADEELREKWRRDFPEDSVPDHEDPPCDRDRWLPRPQSHP